MDDDGTTFGNIHEVVKWVNRCALERQFHEIDQRLVDLYPVNLTTTIIVSWSRSTYPIKDKLPNWKNFISRSYFALMERGEDADNILRGLFPL